MRILSLDPGGHTGYAKLHRLENHFREGAYQDEWSFGTLGPEPHHKELVNLLADSNWDVVIYERFVYQRREITQGVSLNLDAVEYIGLIKWWHASAPDFQLVCQTPAQAKNFWTDEKLKQIGMYEKTKSAHERDALRHVLFYLMQLGDMAYVMYLRDQAPPAPGAVPPSEPQEG